MGGSTPENATSADGRTALGHPSASFQKVGPAVELELPSQEAFTAFGQQ